MATLDKTNAAPATPRVVLPGTRYHRIRKTVQLIFFIAFFYSSAAVEYHSL
jgi:hypothetical protein